MYMEIVTCIWRSLHVYRDRYMYMEIVTCIWRSLHVYGDRYMYMEIVTCIWRCCHNLAHTVDIKYISISTLEWAI